LEPNKPPISATRADVRFGALVVEAKGDFRDKTWALAQKYGRMDDCVYFGPSHRDVVYNMFGDPSESPLQKANKILEILKAFSGGKSGQDPFWDNAARKLFLNTFILHGYIEKAYKEATSPQDKEVFEIAPMSFQFLNILLMDRGQPRNAGEITAAQSARDAVWDKYENCCRVLEQICKKIDVLVRTVEPKRVVYVASANARQEAYEAMVESNAPDSPERDAEIEALGKEVQQDKEIIASLIMTLGSILNGDDSDETLSDDCASLRGDLRGLLNADDDKDRGRYSTHSRDKSKEMDQEMLRRIPYVDAAALVLPDILLLKELFLEFADAAEQMRGFLERLIKMKIPEAQIGALQTMLKQYEEILKRADKEPQLDSVWAFFREEYLNPANDKTSGSVAMVASNLVSLFVHPPFSEIFAPTGTFNFNSAIDEGKIVYLDMPTAYYGAAATVAMLVMKIDFFRCMLSRPRLHKRDPVTGAFLPELVNQFRPMVYFCDEFASVVTTGADTGEAGFLDKVREFKCSCILGTQSIPMLLKTLQDNEVDAILTNTAIKIFLRNTDIKTNEFASKLLGTKTKVNANLNQGAMETVFSENSRPIGSRAFTTSYSKEARFDIGEFTKLQKGQAIVCINPRFGKNQMQKLSFKGKFIPKPDSSPGWGVPVTHIE